MRRIPGHRLTMDEDAYRKALDANCFYVKSLGEVVAKDWADAAEQEVWVSIYAMVQCSCAEQQVERRVRGAS